jgi:hypothetical protein
MSEKSIQDLNDGKPWSEMDLFDLRNSLAYRRRSGVCRSGTVEEAKQGRRIGAVAVQVRSAKWSPPRSHTSTIRRGRAATRACLKA